ncbi:hypothetical protein ABLT32_02215 [Bacteroides pyogenes]|uniref:hypothetical protein n=1 Tax=Bacteroides pyogenes TaxID=310300 RepID=UPI004063D2A1
MVKRYSYVAIVTVEVSGSVINGEWQEGRTEKVEVKGHYDSMNDSRIIIRRNPNGDEKQVSGFFYTKRKPKFEGTPVRLTVPELDIDVPVICWDPYQSHSVINV